MRRTILKPLLQTVTFCVEVVENFFDDECPQLAASLAYYTVLSLPPLLIILVALSGVVLEQDVVERVIKQEVAAVVAPDAMDQTIRMIHRASEWGNSGPWWTVVLSVLGVAFGATRGFAQLQTALNRAWEVRPKSKNVFRNFFSKRLLSIAMIIGMVLLLVISIAIDAILGRFGSFLAELIPPFAFGALEFVSGGVLSILFSTTFLATVYRFLPDAKISWSQVIPGALVTAVLFEGLRSLLTLYLSGLRLDDAFGQAGSLAVLLIWLYLCGLLLFFGAEFTQVWTRRRGNPVVPERTDEEPPKSATETVAEYLSRKTLVPLDVHRREDDVAKARRHTHD